MKTKTIKCWGIVYGEKNSNTADQTIEMKCKEIVTCDTARISKPLDDGKMFLIVGFNRSTKDDEGQWVDENGERRDSAGVCDTCSIPKMMNTGDGINEPTNPILYCHKMKREICPEPPEDRMVECRFYTCR